MGVDWAELPTEILESISERLILYGDYLRFRSVCRSWRTSVAETPLHLPPQLPWLMLSRRSFFDLSTNKTHLFNLPLSSHRTRICGSSHGWLVILDETPQVLLLNPFTRATFHLPPLHTFPNVALFNPSNVGREYLISNRHGEVQPFSLRQMCNSFIRKVVLSSSPSSESDDFAAFAIVGEDGLFYCRKGFDSWVLVGEDIKLFCWEDVVHKNGLFYVVSKGGELAVCDVARPRSPRNAFIESSDFMGFSGDIHYAVFSGEDLLLVMRILEHEFSDAGEESNLVYKTVGFEVFRMGRDVLEWERIETLGDRVLFVGGNSSLSFSASEIVGCSADSIYFTDDYSESNHEDAYGKFDLGIYKLRDKSIEPLPCFPPDSYSQIAWPLPIWVSPNPL